MVNEALYQSGTNPMVCCCLIAGLMTGAPTGLGAEDWSGRFLGSWSRGTSAGAPGPEAPPGSGEVTRLDLANMPRLDFFDLEQGLSGINAQALGAGAARIGSGSRSRFYMIDRSTRSVLHGPEDQAILGVGLEVQLSSQVRVRGSVSSGDNGEGRPSLAPEYRQLAVTAAFRF